jgi:hypothetical protein
MEIMFQGLVAFAVFGGALGVAFYRAGRRAKQRAGDGDDEAVVGTVRQVGELLVAPLSGKPCVAYRAVARTYSNQRRDPLTDASLPRTAAVGSLRSKRRLDDELATTELVPFALVTKDGDVLIAATSCQLLAPELPLIPRKLELEQQFLARMGAEASAAKAGFGETRIEVGAKIKVRGVRAENRLTGDDAHPLVIDRA